MQIRWGKPPRTRQLAGSGWELSREATLRLQWMTHYLQHGHNAAFTCRHFGISKQTFYRWWRRYDPHNLATLEGHSHRPRVEIRHVPAIGRYFVELFVVGPVGALDVAIQFRGPRREHEQR